jgi:hypothetical protein
MRLKKIEYGQYSGDYPTSGRDAMPATIRGVDYFYATVKDRPGEAYRFLSQLSSENVNLLVFNAVPLGPEHTQLVLVPESIEQLARAAEKTGLVLTGPQRALLIQGDDHLGALAQIHQKLCDAKINVYASSGVTDGRGGYGYVLYVRPEDFDNAARLLGI